MNPTARNLSLVICFLFAFSWSTGGAPATAQAQAHVKRTTAGANKLKRMGPPGSRIKRGPPVSRGARLEAPIATKADPAPLKSSRPRARLRAAGDKMLAFVGRGLYGTVVSAPVSILVLEILQYAPKVAQNPAAIAWLGGVFAMSGAMSLSSPVDKRVTGEPRTAKARP